MTLANIITLARIAMTPCFVLALMYYADGVKKGVPHEWQRWMAVALFIITAASDGVDGYVARRMNQKTRLGSILDPIADKGLLLTALVFLTWNPGEAFYPMPLWFPVLVISRDVIVVLGVAVVFMMGRGFDIKPHWVGKVASALQMIAVGLVLVNASDTYWLLPLAAAAICTVISGGIYVVQGSRKLSL